MDDFERNFVPITSIFGKQNDLPDCNKFVSELFNTNLLIVDVYNPS